MNAALLKRLLIRVGIPAVKAGENGFYQVCAINNLILKTGRYVFDEDVRPSEWTKITEQSEEHWNSLHEQIFRRGFFEGDCDDFACTGMTMALAIGVPRANLNFEVGSSEADGMEAKASRRRRTVDHMYASYFDRTGAQGPSRYIFDTWDQESWEIMPPVADKRHLTAWRMNMAKTGTWLNAPEWPYRDRTYGNIAGRPVTVQDKLASLAPLL